MVPKKTAAKKAAKKKTAANHETPEAATQKRTARKMTRNRIGVAARSDAEVLAVDAARIADETKAEDIVVLDVSKVSSITDFFILCTGTSMPHLKAITRDLREKMVETRGVKPMASEGQSESQWLVLDYGVIMVHVFHQSKRELYALEDLWSDARRVEWRKGIS
jgi:ribosome-associated protein